MLLSFPCQAVHNLCHFDFRGIKIFFRCSTFVFIQSMVLCQRATPLDCKLGLESAEDGVRPVGGLASPPSLRSPFSEGGFRPWRHQPTNETPTPRWTGNLFQSLNHFAVQQSSNVQTFHVPLSSADTMFPNDQFIQ